MSKSKSKSKIDEITKKRQEIGERIRAARTNAGYTQQKVADELTKKLYSNGSQKKYITAQSVSYWENGTFLPSTENLILLSEVLGVSVSSLVEDRSGHSYKTKKLFFDVDRSYKHVQDIALTRNYKNTIKALPFVKKAFEGSTLKNADIPTISHPLSMACHILAMGIDDDEIIAAALLHDVVEDTDYTLEDLPVNNNVKELVDILTRPVGCKKDQNKQKKYFKGIESNPKAALIKLVDRCNNISKMVWGLSHDSIHKNIIETDEYVIPLLRSIKNGEYDNACYLLSYQIQTTLDIYKRIMN